MIIDVINEGIANAKDEISDELINLMLENIGSIDPILRDKTIYSGFYKLFSQRRISNIQKHFILQYVLDKDLLNFKIGRTDDDSVFTRSFVALLFVLLLEDHYVNPWIEENIEKQIIQYIIEYLHNEKDTRGYVEDKGWAHAFAHGSDLLATISKSKYFSEESGLVVLEIVKNILKYNYPLLYGEEGRLSKALVVMIENRKIAFESLNNIINEITEYHIIEKKNNSFFKKFIMTLIFTLKYSDSCKEYSKLVSTRYLEFSYKYFRCI
jgi:hypothetical protein